MKRLIQCRATVLWLAIVAVVSMWGIERAIAQTPALSSWVIVSPQGEGVHFSAVNGVRSMRVQVKAQDESEIFDSGTLPGGEVGWSGNDVQGKPVPTGIYYCVITLTDQTGKVHIDNESVSVQRAEAPVGAPAAGTAAPPAVGVSTITTKAVAPLTGQGTIGRIPKWVGINQLGDSIMTESSGKIGINNTAPSATLHITGPVLPTASGAGASAASLLIVNGGAGANTSGSAKGGSGGSISLSAGAGGRAPAGGTNGSGGNITLTPGAAGSGPGAVGSAGKVLIAPNIGNVGIGTSNPASKLAVAGTIQSTTGGFKFPDGTTQTTAATNSGGLTSVTHNGTLIGQGTSSQPLGVKAPLILSAGSTDAIVNATNTGSGYALSGTSANSAGVFGSSTESYGVAGTSANSVGLYGVSSTGTGVYGYSSSGSAGVYGTAYSSTGSGVQGNAYGGSAAGVLGINTSGPGVWGRASGGAGVYGQSSGYAVYGVSSGGVGVYGVSSNGGVIGTGYVGVQGQANGTTDSQGIRGEDGANGSSTSTYAAVFNGRVIVTGTLIKPGGSFKIDHPVDPANKYLSHSFVESPDMMNVYNGNITTNANGEATVQLPSYFEALNRDFRYQLTSIGTFAQAIVASEVKDNHFTIKTDKPNVKVSWQVTGIRQDAWANAHRISNEEDKTGAERGHYLHPAEFGQPADKAINAIRLPAPAIAAAPKPPEVAAVPNR